MSEALEQHPIGKILPSMSDDDYKSLVDDMKAHGFSSSHPIVIHEEMILDGWHRHLASLEIGIRAEYIHFIAPDMADTPLDFVIRENLHRRHLTTSQRSAVAAEIMERLLGEEADKSSNLKISRGPEGSVKGGEEAVTKAAETMQVSKVNVRAAAKLKQSSPDEFNAVKAGKQSVNKAKAKADKETDEHAKAVKLIEAALGEGWVEKRSKLTAADTLRLARLIPEEMERVRPYLESGWKLKDAVSYKIVPLTHAHSIRQLIDRAIQHGKFVLEIDGWVIEVKKKEP